MARTKKEVVETKSIEEMTIEEQREYAKENNPLLVYNALFRLNKFLDVIEALIPNQENIPELIEIGKSLADENTRKETIETILDIRQREVQREEEFKDIVDRLVAKIREYEPNYGVKNS